MNLNTRLLRISRPRHLSHPNGNASLLLFASARRQRQSTISAGSNLSSRPYAHRLPKQSAAAAAAAAVAQRGASTTTTTTATTPAAKQQETRPSDPESRGPPAVAMPYDPKAPAPGPPTPQDPIPLSATLNPPASTRPPPLVLPTREPETSQMTYLFHVGKAYMQFYKTGLKAIFTNRRLLSSVAPPPLGLSSSSSAGDTWPTRAVALLRARTRHDLARLPVFAVLLLLCGEFTPLIVLVFPRLTPLTCRIPRQVEALRRGAVARREASFRALSVQRNRLRYVQEQKQMQKRDGYEGGKGKEVIVEESLAAGHIARSLGLTSHWWDTAGLDGPFARSRADQAVAFLARDDAMIRAAGGVAGVEDEEVVLACEDRGMDVRGKEVGELRKRLEAWVRGSEGADEEDSKDRVRRLLLDSELSM